MKKTTYIILTLVLFFGIFGLAKSSWAATINVVDQDDGVTPSCDNGYIHNGYTEPNIVPALEAVNWTAGSGWSAGGGVITKTAGTSSNTMRPTTPITIIAGKWYEIGITATFSGGSSDLAATVGGSSVLTPTYIDGNAHYYSVKFVAGGTGNLIMTASTAVSLSYVGIWRIHDDVQAAINAASDGDTIVVPAGAGTWTSAVSWRDKKINVIGAGIGKTIITGDVNLFSINNSTNKPFRLSGFTLQGTANSEAIIKLTSEYNRTGPSSGWRIDHLEFNYQNVKVIMLIYGINHGLIDHITTNITNFTDGYTFDLNSFVDGEWRDNMGNKAWSYAPTNYGSADALYIEDSTFNYNYPGNNRNNSVLDSINGSRVVFRYNKVYATYLQSHTALYSNRSGSLKYEIYNNLFDGTCTGCNGGNFIWPIFQRGGTGLIYNNTVKNYLANVFVIDTWRFCGGIGGGSDPLNMPNYYACDGSHAWDGNLEASGWPCLDQIGRGSGVAINNAEPSVPMFVWNNGPQDDCRTTQATCDGSVVPTLGALCDFSTDIKTTPHTINGDVDYCTHSPATACGNYNTAYTPYTYPHPLQGAGTVLYGDVSGDSAVSAYDAALVAQAAVGLISFTSSQIKAGDVSGDGVISAYDAALIAQKAVGLITKFPVEP